MAKPVKKTRMAQRGASPLHPYNLLVRTMYLDNNSTTRTAPEVVAAMGPYWREDYGNASSLHGAGQRARHAVERAREQVGGLIGARSREIVFTGGGTESDNLAILGTLSAYPGKRHIVTTSVEHVAIHSLCERLETQGYRVTRVGVDPAGRLDLDGLSGALTDDTAIVSVMHANNETGVVFPIPEIAAVVAARGVVLHVDAVQTAGRVPVDVRALGAGLVSVSAHKMHGPKGVGALYVGPGVRLRSVAVGGHQERDLRPGTENVPAIVGFGVAAELARTDRSATVSRLRDRLEGGLLERVPKVQVIGDRAARVPGTTTLGFEGLESEAILIALSEAGVCASTGSACSSGALEPSHVLQAMGIAEVVARGAVRFSLSRETTSDEIDAVLEIVPRLIQRLHT